jgi:hypothetical protein
MSLALIEVSTASQIAYTSDGGGLNSFLKTFPFRWFHNVQAVSTTIESNACRRCLATTLREALNFDIM